MSRNIRPIGGGGGGGAYGGPSGGAGGRQPSRGGAGAGNNPRSKSTKDLVTRAYNNNIIVKNEDGEYAPIGKFSNISKF